MYLFWLEVAWGKGHFLNPRLDEMPKVNLICKPCFKALNHGIKISLPSKDVHVI